MFAKLVVKVNQLANALEERSSQRHIITDKITKVTKVTSVITSGHECNTRLNKVKKVNYI